MSWYDSKFRAKTFFSFVESLLSDIIMILRGLYLFVINLYFTTFQQYEKNNDQGCDFSKSII